LGVAAVDRHLPDEGLMRHGLHDVAPDSYGDTSAAMGFVLALAIKRLTLAGERRPLLWCRLRREAQEHGALYGHGAEALGLSRQRLLTVTLPKPASMFWTLEEALKSGALAAVIGDADETKTDLTITRRLSLAAHAGKAAGLLLFTRQHTGATASMSRWLVKSVPSPKGSHAVGVGPPAWDVSLTRIRGGKPGHWTLSWYPQEHAPHHFTLVSSLPRGTFHPYAEKNAQARGSTVTALRAG
jgi:protein ImuA